MVFYITGNIGEIYGLVIYPRKQIVIRNGMFVIQRARRGKEAGILPP